MFLSDISLTRLIMIFLSVSSLKLFVVLATPLELGLASIASLKLSSSLWIILNLMKNKKQTLFSRVFIKTFLPTLWFSSASTILSKLVFAAATLLESGLASNWVHVLKHCPFIHSDSLPASAHRTVHSISLL